MTSNCDRSKTIISKTTKNYHPRADENEDPQKTIRKIYLTSNCDRSKTTVKQPKTIIRVLTIRLF